MKTLKEFAAANARDPKQFKVSAIVDAKKRVYDVPKEHGAVTGDDPVFWNPKGDPVNGTPGTGAATTDADSGFPLIGRAEKDALDLSAVVRVVVE